MRKILLLVALAFAMTMSAQNEHKFAIKAGAGLSTLVGSDSDGCKTILSYTVGASYDLSLSEKFSVIPGLELAKKGWKEDGVEGDINMGYIQVPVFAALKFPLGEAGTSLSIKVGPYVSYGLYGSDIYFADINETINVFDEFERFDYGAIAGVSLDFDDVFVGIEYSRGLAKVHSSLKAYNQVIGLNVGYKF